MKNINIVSWNVNGIRALIKKGGLKELEQIEADIYCLQETKIHNTNLTPDFYNLMDNYKTYYNCAEKKGYSGVCVFTKNDPKDIIYGIGKDEYDTEGRSIGLIYDEFEVYNVYFPNGNASKERLEYKMGFYAEFSKMISERQKEEKKIIVCGDVNTAHKEIDLSRPKENENTSGFLKIEREWIDSFINQGFVDTLRFFTEEKEIYTWWDLKTRARERNVGWRIDYFFASNNMKENLIEAKVYNQIYGSDHCPIGLKINI